MLRFVAVPTNLYVQWEAAKLNNLYTVGTIMQPYIVGEGLPLIKGDAVWSGEYFHMALAM
jgi:hypothetical protein